MNKLRWNLNQDTKFFIYKTFENVGYEMTAILSGGGGGGGGGVQYI